MSFEERMERLTERHEALAQSVEMHNAMLTSLEFQLKGLMASQRQKTNHHQREMLAGLLLAADRVLKASFHIEH